MSNQAQPDMSTKMVLYTDFNNIRYGDRVSALYEQSPFIWHPHLYEGRCVRFIDGEGCECDGVLTGIDFARKRVWGRLDWETWRCFYDSDGMA